MILVDTNILIAIIRTGDAKFIGLLQQHVGAMCGVVRAELLAGARSPAERAQALSMLATLGTVSTPRKRLGRRGGQSPHTANTRRDGPVSRLVLATLAIANNLELWTRDAHFTLIHQWLPALKLFQEPP